MNHLNLDTWLRWLRVTATFICIAALCFAVALLVIALIPGSPVAEELPATALSHLGSIGGITAGAAVDPSGWVPFTVHDPSLGQRLLHLFTVLPGLLLVAEIARRMAHLLRMAQASDPFTATTARALWTLGKLTGVAGVCSWVVTQIAEWILSATMLNSATAVRPHHSPWGWLALGLIFAGFGLILDRGVAMRAELDTVI